MPNCPLKEAARDAPNHLAIFSRNKSQTFAELDAYADQLTTELRLSPGDCLPIAEPSSIRLIALFFAVWRLGASILPLNPRLPPRPYPLKAPERSALLFTSGSTAAPKIAILSLSNLIASASGAISTLDLRPGDQWLLSLPLYHVGGIGILFRSILARATIVLDDSPDITHLSYIPTHLYRATPVYKKLRCLLLGGAPVGRYPEKLPIYVTYGLTEMGSLVVARHRPPSPYLGHPLPGREVRIDEAGEIWVRGACLFQGYLGAPPPADWFATGDLGRYCPKEGLAITGRKDWQFISGGENIQPEEIERELLALPNITEAVVVPIDDAEFGKRPIAVVCGNIELSALQNALKDKLPKYKIPIALHIIDEMPKNGLKIDRIGIERLTAKRGEFTK